jgi:microcystin-dependent protein
MATVTGLTAERMLEIESASVVDGEIVDGHLILTKYDGTEIDAGPVTGPAGPAGPTGSGGLPGEVKIWPGTALPNLAQFGKWVWADGGVYPVATYPLSAANIATAWRTFAGASDPGGSNFRVPDLRGLIPVGMDAMPGGARANRMTRAVAITIAARTGEETHIITVPELAPHGHAITDPGHTHTTPASGGTYPAAPGADSVAQGGSGSTGSKVTGITINNTGSGIGHENVQPSVFIPYIVCLNG